MLLYSCGSSDDNQPNNIDDFERSNILTNSYDNIIIPAYNKLNNDISDLDAKTNSFISNLNEQSLIDLRSSWVRAYKSWQAVEMFDLRKAEQINYIGITNSYPCIEDRVITNINDTISNIVSFTASMLGATGFPAIGYMIYGNDSTSTITNFTGTDGFKYRAYLSALVQNIVQNTNLVISDWNSSRSDFVNSTGNTQTSSLNIIVNDFVRYFEKRVRTAKIGNPIDYFGGMQPKPNQVESYYRPDICKDLLTEAMHSVKRFYYGEYFDGTSNGDGLKDYLTYLDNADDLITAIDNQFIDIENKINLLENDFILELSNNHRDRMEDVFLSMQSLVTYFKADMMTDRFGISPDYADNDGDGG